MKTKHISLVCLFALSGSILQSCSGDQNSSTPVTEPIPESSIVETEYEYPDLKLDQKEINILNSESVWSIYMNLDFETISGETLDDAVYNRNRTIESMFDCRIVVDEYASGGDFNSYTNQAYNIIFSGDDKYEVMYLKPAGKLDIVTEGMLHDLRSLGGLNLDSDWWDKVVSKAAEVDGKLYFTSGCLHLMPFETSWCLYFNESLFERNQIDNPYDLVRSGDWTLEKLTEICRANCSLNGDESYTYKRGGNSVYGVSSHTNAISCMLFGAGVRYVSNENGEFVYSLTGDRFHDAVETISSLTASEGAYFKASDSDWDAEVGGYIYTFANDRALFLTGQIKTANQLRDMNSEFGILPFPKLDDTQDEYYTYITGNNLMLTIPVTNQSPEETASILDALTYYSYKNLLPIYYGNKVEQKGLRNDDSIEMLDYIRSGRGIDIADYFLLNSSVTSELTSAILNSTGTAASIAESNRSKVETAITVFMEAIEKEH